MNDARKQLEQDLVTSQAAIASAEQRLDSARDTIAKEQSASGKIILRLLELSALERRKSQTH